MRNAPPIAYHYRWSALDDRKGRVAYPDPWHFAATWAGDVLHVTGIREPHRFVNALLTVCDAAAIINEDGSIRLSIPHPV